MVFRKKGESIEEAIYKRIRERGYTPLDVRQKGWYGIKTREDLEGIKEYLEITQYGPREDWNWMRFAAQLDKEFGSHDEMFWHKLQETVSYTINILKNLDFLLDENGNMQRKYVDEVRYLLEQGLIGLKEKCDRLHSKEEKEAYLRLQDLLKTLYKLLKKTYPIYWD